jgi:hypothetical protein
VLASPYRYKFTDKKPPKYPVLVDRHAVRGHLKETASQRLGRLAPEGREMGFGLAAAAVAQALNCILLRDPRFRGPPSVLDCSLIRQFRHDLPIVVHAKDRNPPPSRDRARVPRPTRRGDIERGGTLETSPASLSKGGSAGADIVARPGSGGTKVTGALGFPQYTGKRMLRSPLFRNTGCLLRK